MKTNTINSLRERVAAHVNKPLIAAVLVLFTWFVLRMMAYTDGHRCSPLDDTFIHLQYADQIAQGNYYRYQPEDLPTTGATSFLYAHLLAVPALLGFDGKNLLTVAAAMNLVFFYLCLLYLGRLTTAMFGKGAGRLAVLLGLTNGALLWGIFSQMEIALLAFLAVICAWEYRQYLLGSSNAFRLGIVAALLAFARPEGAIMACLLAGFLLVQKVARTVQERRLLFTSADLWLLLPVGAYLLQMLHHWILTGETSSAGLLAKSEFSPAIVFWQQGLKASIRHSGEILQVLLGIAPAVFEYFPLGALIFFVIGVFVRGSQTAGTSPRKWNRLIFASIRPWLLISVLLVILAISTLTSYNLHHWRYLMPLFPFVFVGVSGAVRSLSFGRRWFFFVLCILLLGGQLWWLPSWAERYGIECGIHQKKHFALARWIRRNLPEDASLAINDAGILAFASERPCFDLVGLTTRGTAIPFRTGYGALGEFLERLPEEERFDYYCVFPSWFPAFDKWGLFGEEVIRINDPYSSPHYEKAIYRASWDWAGSGNAPKSLFDMPGWEIRDRLDVADLQSEKQHHYEILPGPEYSPPIDLQAGWVYFYRGEDRIDWHPVDGGREHRGGERFTLRNLTPGLPARLILRTANPMGENDYCTARVEVFASGIQVEPFDLSPPAWRTTEEWIQIPADRITRQEIEIELHHATDSASPFYAVYHYWICQPAE